MALLMFSMHYLEIYFIDADSESGKFEDMIKQRFDLVQCWLGDYW
jgi:hypothetical protein